MSERSRVVVRRGTGTAPRSSQSRRLRSSVTGESIRRSCPTARKNAVWHRNMQLPATTPTTDVAIVANVLCSMFYVWRESKHASATRNTQSSKDSSIFFQCVK